MVFHFNHSMYYANADLFEEQVLALVHAADPPLIWLSVDMSSVDDVDFTAAEGLRETKRLVGERGVELVLVEVADDVRYQLARSGLMDAFGSDHVFDTLSEAEAAFRAREGKGVAAQAHD
jgi:MFS superfamily sulfate permease-like transporter